MSPKKTQIFKVSQPIKFLGFSFKIMPSSKVIMRLLPKKVSHERRKLKKLVERAKAGIMTKEQVDTCFTAWKAHAKHGNTYFFVRNMTKFYNELWR